MISLFTILKINLFIYVDPLLIHPYLLICPFVCSVRFSSRSPATTEAWGQMQERSTCRGQGARPRAVTSRSLDEAGHSRRSFGAAGRAAASGSSTAREGQAWPPVVAPPCEYVTEPFKL
jgi:hypothetical protein